MEKTAKITHCSVDVGDWEAIYINEELVVENHSISIHDMFKIISEFQHFEKDIESYEISEEDIEELGFSFPADFNGIPKEMLK